MNVRKRGLALLMCICMIFTLLPFSAFADATTVKDGHAKIGDQDYDSLDLALAAANNGDTIYLGAGDYSSYGNTYLKDKGFTLTFIGAGADKTKWYIGSPTPDMKEEGTEYNGDYSFDGNETITFDNIGFSVYPSDYKGFIRIKNFVVKNCVIDGTLTYGGTSTSTYENVVFNAPSNDYSFHSIDSDIISFKDCTFNGNGKFINVYKHWISEDKTITVNFDSCTVNATAANKQPLNIKNHDSSRDTGKNVNWIINITGKNIINYPDNIEAVYPDDSTKHGQVNTTTCSRLFAVQTGNGDTDKYVTVNIDGTPVWEDGKMVSHAIDTTNDKYTDGYKDNAITVKEEGNTVTKTCQYCGWTESYTKQDWNINVSKTATDLKKDANGDYKTNVTLSVPGVQQSLDSDVVFVLDKSTSAELETASLDMLTALKEQVKNTGAKVKVGVVIFNKVANVTAQLTDISTDEGFNKVKAGIESEFESGTNTHAGLLAGKALLDNDTSVSADRKYLIFVSDGVTYQFCKDDVCTKAYTRNFNGSLHADKVNQCGTLAEIDVQYPGTQGKTSVPKGSIEAWMAYITSRIGTTDNDSENYDYEYTGQAAPEAQQMLSRDCVSNVEKALYLTKQVYTAAQKEGYKCYSVLAKDTYKFGTDFMNMLAGGETLSFDTIENKILYAVGTGSYVVDKIGDDFTLDVSTLKLKVGNDELTGTFDESTNAWSFGSDVNGNARFTAAYDAASKTLTWTFGEAVSNFAPVQLSYTLQLTKPETTPGTYGQLDLNGDGTIDKTTTKVDTDKALYTNEKATLTPVDSNGKEGVNKDFPKPSVEYTVRNPYRPPVNPGIGDEIIVEITGNSDSVVYDGTEHSVKDYTVKISDPRYTEADFTFTGKAEASGVNAGTYEMGLKAEQFKNTNARFTNVKFVIKADGVLTITPKELTITAGSAEGIAPVTCDKYTVEGLATGDKVDSVKLTGIQSEPGESPNVASDAVIKNAKGEDVTANYKITYVDGVLKAIEVLNKEIHFNYVIGYTDGTIRPNNDISRAEVATIFFRLLTDEAREQYTTTAGNFTDVKAGMWCNRAIATLTNMGIIKGYTDGSFQPNKSITRAELATIIARFAKLDVNTKTFSDINGHWAQKNIELAAGNGWINGYEDGTFRPNNNITRAETFAMINRVLDRQTESVSDLLPTSDMNMWSDNLNENAWYYKDVQEATNYHKCDRVGDSVYEKWTEKVPDIDWASYQI